jgi:16S rRNA (cytosine967-C5)-methyltransferase
MGVTRQELDQLKEKDPATGWSHPDWLVERWKARWPDAFRKLLEWNNTPARTFARVNTLRIKPEQLLNQWREEGVEYEFFTRDWISEGQIFALKSFPPLATLPSFMAGGFYIQDPSTLLAVRNLDPEPGDTVLDLCAAPGGKATLIAQYMENQGRVVAYDNSKERLALVRENCARLGVSCVQVHTHDPAGIAFDKILVDAPCSNTGVLRRRIESRWRLSAEELTQLATTQLALLERAAVLLKPGGILVYSTCSLEPEENTGVLDRFLERHPEFEREDTRELLPMRDGVDGAFVARISTSEKK